MNDDAMLASARRSVREFPSSISRDFTSHVSAFVCSVWLVVALNTREKEH